MFTLLLDTSTEQGIAALAQGKHVLASKSFVTGGPHGEPLFSILDTLLQSQNITPANLQRVAVGNGPGSYTGIRVAVMIAKTLAFAQNIPLIGISTLKLFIPENDATFAAMIDARIGGFYMIIGKRSGNKVNYLSEPQLVALDE